MTATIEEMVDKLEMYVNDRQIGIAGFMANEFANDKSTSPFKESGYAILSIAMAYFEVIEQFCQGQDSEGKSKKFFREGVKRVYPGTPLSDPEIDDLYKLVRCGMYHGGMTQRTILSRHFTKGFGLVGTEFHINPAIVVDEIKAHFQQYTALLREPACTIERANFQTLCLQLGIDKTPHAVVVSSTGVLTKTTPDPTAPG